MAITNPFSIQWGTFQVGGSTAYLLDGPYVIDKSDRAFSLVFDVTIARDSYSALQSAAETLEDEFRKRDQNLTISLDGSTWTYTHGTNLLNAVARIAKSGDVESDKGYSRRYSVTITGELPADDNSGLRDLMVQVGYETGRQKIVTFQGVYTPHGGNDASAQYLADFDSEASTILSAIDGGATWELVDEDYQRDRNDHTCNFTRQYVQLVFDQSEGSRDHADVRGHRVVFTNLSSHPGDAQEDVWRLRRVVAVYEAWADIEQNTDLGDVLESVVLPFIAAHFQDEFDPQVFGREDQRLQYDETSKRLSAQVTYVYQPSQGGDVVEVAYTQGYREGRTIDYTPIHDGRELSAFADPGWASVERITSRTVIVLGEETPKRRIGQEAQSGPAGQLEGVEAPPDVQQSGWNRIANTSEVSPQFIGDPEGEQVRVTVLTESVTERYNEAPESGAPITPSEGSYDTPGTGMNPSQGPTTNTGASGGGGTGG